MHSEPMTKAEVEKLYGQMETFGLSNASFTYRSDDAPVVLDGLDLEIRKGEIAANKERAVTALNRS